MEAVVARHHVQQGGGFALLADGEDDASSSQCTMELRVTGYTLRVFYYHP